MLAELESRTPPGAAELMRLPSIGPKRARILAENLHVQTLDELREAAVAGRIHELPGFGESTETRILHELETRAAEETRVCRPVAVQYAGSLLRCGRPAANVSSRTDFVVAGERPGAKLDEARRRGIGVLSESDLLRILGRSA